MLNSEDFNDAKHQLEEFREKNKISVPTPYQDPESYNQFQKLCLRISI